MTAEPAEITARAAPPAEVPASEASERGRYAVYETADGGWRIATVGPLGMGRDDGNAG